MTQEKIIDRLTKMKAHMESARAIGSEAEAQAFAEMLQRLLLKHKIEMTDLEYSQMEVEEPVGYHRIDYTQYPDIKVAKVRILWIEDLTSIIARAHFCRIMVHPRSSRITLIGRKSDCACAEFMIITLQRFVTKLANEEAHLHWLRVQLSHQKNERVAVHNEFRSSFTTAFCRRLAQRYEEEKKAQEGTSSTALVRVQKADQDVLDFMAQQRNRGNLKKVDALSTPNIGSSAGWHRGLKAANEVNLRSNAVEGASQPRKAML